MFRKSVAQTSVDHSKPDVEPMSTFDRSFDSTPHSCGTFSDACSPWNSDFETAYPCSPSPHEALNYVGPDSFEEPLYEDEAMEDGPLLPDVSVGSVDSCYNGAQHQYDDNQTGYVAGYPASIEIQKECQAISNWQSTFVHNSLIDVYGQLAEAFVDYILPRISPAPKHHEKKKKRP
ncbi:hypothetical protein M422DRAFT_254254 [Sphaerobolus stellatus SS14]|uniref:Unplaced genomic scaffold SPHSTscaffold_54, whole genome shotgun sequence n=1 Tax=Sphaerobolus stellatus (strain SS14) TaxID=990650 RepID=A0A0C9VV80_SPHS4|nr:hypothetical protein M422DRAFT_254254 [Sphaerobolus stellatus SS14]